MANKKGVSIKTHTQQQLNDYANQHNPNNKAYKANKANQKVNGSGIGLAVADEIVKQHEGLIFVESTEGVGTTVTVVLPLAEEIERSEPEVIISPTPRVEDEVEKEEQQNGLS